MRRDVIFFSMAWISKLEFCQFTEFCMIYFHFIFFHFSDINLKKVLARSSFYSLSVFFRTTHVFKNLENEKKIWHQFWVASIEIHDFCFTSPWPRRIFELKEMSKFTYARDFEKGEKYSRDFWQTSHYFVPFFTQPLTVSITNNLRIRSTEIWKFKFLSSQPPLGEYAGGTLA